MTSNQLDLTSFTADIVAAYVSHNVIGGDKLPDFISSVYGALHKAYVQGIEPPKVELIPAVPVKKSVTHDYIICLEDGKRFKSLKKCIIDSVTNHRIGGSAGRPTRTGQATRT